MNNKSTTPAQSKTLYKSDLALLYNPGITPAYALVILNRWIAHYPGLLPRLEETGYTKKQKILTPAQVRLITDALGEP